MVYITGDIHGDALGIMKMCFSQNMDESDVIVILGDVCANYFLDYRDDILKEDLNCMKPTIFCVHGNHEERPQNIKTYIKKMWNGGEVMYQDKYPNILFPVDGEVFTLNGYKCLVSGGAYSVDKFFRLSRGAKWFPDEQPSDSIKKDVEKAIENNNIDIVFTHTCPFRYIPVECFIPGIDQSTVDNSTEVWLDEVEQKISNYKAWYCGHWHINKRIDKMHFLFDSFEILE